MPNIIYFILDTEDRLIAGVKFDDNSACILASPSLADLFIGHRKETISRLCDEKGWKLVMPRDLPNDKPL
jgi:hypothetical protein